MPDHIIDTAKGAAVYSPLVLRLYDWWVLGVSNRFAWRCATRKVLMPFFRRHIGPFHLDVGVGTGFYLKGARIPRSTKVTLMDLNAGSLEAARQRIVQGAARTVTHDVMTPMPPSLGYGFDSISLFYLLHCLPGTMAEKGAVFGHLKHHLARTGVLYGATILGDGAGHNALGRRLMALYNRKGIFGNRSDTAAALEHALTAHFSDVQVRVVGKVALFEARSPKVGIRCVTSSDAPDAPA